jgi:O-antigen ligase/Tfp pilus assembly protein PilF
MTKKLINYLTIILFLIPFSLLIVDNNVLFPFITTKAIFFRILVSLGLVFALWLYLLNPDTFPKKNYLFLAICLFFIANIVSTIFSVNPFRSFWGNAERMEGLWSLFFYLSYFFLLFTLFQFNPQAKKTIFYSILIVTTLISIIELQQAFIYKEGRPSATLGNPTYIGFLNLLTIFLILYFYFEAKNFEKYFYILLIVLNLLSLIASQTRGSILGLLVGIFVFFFFYFLLSKIETKKKILAFGLFFIFLISFFFFLKTDIALQIPGIKRLSETLQNPVSVFPRLYAWKIFLNSFKEKPLFGWGPETMPIAFFSNFDPRIFNYEQAIFDRPHNKFIEILVSTGLFGFVSWLLIFLAFIYYVFKTNINFYQKATLLAFLFSYLAQNFSLFDMQASYILFFYGLSLITQKIEFKENKESFIRPYLILISGLSLIMIIIHIQHFYVVRKIITYLRESDPKIASEGFHRLAEIAGPFLSEEAHMVMNYISSNLNKIKDAQTFFNFYDVVKKAYEKDSKDYKTVNAYLSFKTMLIEVQKQIGQDPSKEIQEVQKIHENLISMYPNLPEIYVNYAKFLYENGQKEKAGKILTQGEKITKYYPKYYLYEAVFYFSLKENSLAYEKLNLALKNNFQFLLDQDFEAGLRIYLANQDVENSKNLISLWLKQNNSSSTEQKITKILEEYHQTQLLKLDKK